MDAAAADASSLASLMLIIIITTMMAWGAAAATPCRDSCSGGGGGDAIKIKYPFGIDSGCGAPQYEGLLDCRNTPAGGGGGLFLLSGGSTDYKVQGIDYERRVMTIQDTSIPTCLNSNNNNQPAVQHNNTVFLLNPNLIAPSYDTVLAILNCSLDSPLLHSKSSLCFPNLTSTFGGGTCNDLYGACDAFRNFRLPANGNATSNATPPCCFTTYSTLAYMNMDMLDCTHYTSFYASDDMLKNGGGGGSRPTLWPYGIKLSFALPPDGVGCDCCIRTGGTCGFDALTRAPTCISSSSTTTTTATNYTTVSRLVCGDGSGGGHGARGRESYRAASTFLQILVVCYIIITPSVRFTMF